MFCESGLMIISLLIAAHKYLRCFGNRALICAAGDELAGGKTDTRRGPSVRGARFVRTPRRAVSVTSPRRLIGPLSDSSRYLCRSLLPFILEKKTETTLKKKSQNSEINSKRLKNKTHYFEVKVGS